MDLRDITSDNINDIIRDNDSDTCSDNISDINSDDRDFIVSDNFSDNNRDISEKSLDDYCCDVRSLTKKLLDHEIAIKVLNQQNLILRTDIYKELEIIQHNILTLILNKSEKGDSKNAPISL